MPNFNSIYIKSVLIFCIFTIKLNAQTDVDGLMMAKRNLCVGLAYNQSSWNHYWEGQSIRTNENLGTVSTKATVLMANYGISDKLNVIAMAPYIKTNASAGTLIGQSGLQDLTMLLKYEFLSKVIKRNFVSLLAFGGYSTPLTNYVPDYLPLSIGMHSTSFFGKIMIDIQRGKWYITGSANYMVRNNVTIDRDAYYTTKMIYSNQVAMPNMWGSNIRLGYRKDAELVIEGYLDCMNTIGGYDMRKNEMPFLSNTMNACRVGLNLKIPIPKLYGFSFIGNALHTISGRNMGQSNAFMAGLLFQTEFSKSKK